MARNMTKMPFLTFFLVKMVGGSMPGVTALIFLSLLAIQSTHATYDPAKDDGISLDNDDVVMMKNGRPDMKHFQTMMEKMDSKSEEEGFEEVDLPPEELSEEEEDEEIEEMAVSNRKRFVINNPHHFWDFGILPYKFDSSLPTSNQKNIKEVVIPKYEYWTHFRFPEWNNSVPKLYNLSHQNYLLFITQNGCWSHVGNNKHAHGQKLSCCKGNACVHEIGHSIGFHHEQSNPLRDDYIRINYENILDGKGSNFGEKSLSGNRIFGYFDIGSIMEYGSMAFNKNKKETITTFDPDLVYLMHHQDTAAFYMFYEAQTLYKMKDQMCPHFPIECVNDGYVSYINNTCKCRCPTGMDSRTGCATPTSSDIWPEGEYSILKPESDCPAGFVPGELKLWKNMTVNTNVFSSPHSHLAESLSKRYITLSFCTKRYQHMPGTAPQWSDGRYCILKSTSACPKVGHLNISPNSVFVNFSKSGVVPDFSLSPTLKITTCCHDDGSVAPMKMPTQKPIILHPLNNHRCQAITGMKVHQESLTVGVRNGSQTSTSVCYYIPDLGQPATEPCGDMIYLSDNNPIVHVTSPHYPSNYNGSKTCSWFVKAPKNSKVLIEFTDFAINGPHAQGCNGHLELRYYLPGEHGVTYCGSGFNKTIISYFEKTYMILTPPSSDKHKRFLITPSGTTTANSDYASRRFNVTFKLVKETALCYTQQGKDNSYQGHVNYGHNFERCLPWDRVVNCPHNVFNEVEHDLEGNYCRNPGFGTEPWCYTDAETCARAYCDACQMRRCYDLFSDCAKEMIKDLSYCQTNPEAVRGCRQSCGLCGSIPKSAPVSIKTCRRPSLTLPDGRAVGKLKRYYRVEENVTYACNIDGNETHIITCTSEGTWTHLSYACGGCPHGWRMFDGYCYKFINSRQKKTIAIQRCHQEKHGAIVSPAESEAETNLLRDMAGHNNVWLGGHSQPSHGHDTLVWEDGHTVNYTNWLNDTAWPHHGNKKCLIMTPNKVWDNTNCAYKNKFVCKAKATETQVCLDQRTDCSLLIDRTPDLCVKYAHTFAILKCAKSCGLCTNKGHSNAATCTVTDKPGNATMIWHISTLQVGKIVRYSCNTGYHLAEGDLVSACKLTGQLSGTPPVCLAIDDMVSEVGDADIRRRHKVGAARTAYVLSNKYNRITRKGEITAWRFYSNHGGEVALQVWRPVGNTSHHILIGQNVISDTLDDRLVTVNVTKSERISVQPGDFIGVFFPRSNHGGITYDDCKTAYDPEGGDELQSVNRPYKVSNWIAGHQYGMHHTSACRIFSLKAFIGPV